VLDLFISSMASRAFVCLSFSSKMRTPQPSSPLPPWNLKLQDRASNCSSLGYGLQLDTPSESLRLILRSSCNHFFPEKTLS
jgi:hypothetical protein